MYASEDVDGDVSFMSGRGSGVTREKNGEILMGGERVMDEEG